LARRCLTIHAETDLPAQKLLLQCLLCQQFEKHDVRLLADGRLVDALWSSAYGSAAASAARGRKDPEPLEKRQLAASSRVFFQLIFHIVLGWSTVAVDGEEENAQAGALRDPIEKLQDKLMELLLGFLAGYCYGATAGQVRKLASVVPPLCPSPSSRGTIADTNRLCSRQRSVSRPVLRSA
jgi:hypothetical protein